eukprot:6457319-Amphidinium_carterae.3
MMQSSVIVDTWIKPVHLQWSKHDDDDDGDDGDDDDDDDDDGTRTRIRQTLLVWTHCRRKVHL